MKSRTLAKTFLTVGLGLSIALAGATGGQAQTASAATAYETTIVGGVNLRANPSVNAKVYKLIPRGQTIHVIEKVNAYWLKVKTRDGRTGYISASGKYSNYGNSGTGTGAVSSGGKAGSVIAIAKSYMGRVSYDYGTRNTSRLIFDCSSFTEFVFAKVGVDLKWGTKQQKTQGSAVAKSNLREGDLVFFDTVGSNNRAINHVGIYMGGGQFIHNTPSKDGLAVNNLNEGWWADHYVLARRVI